MRQREHLTDHYNPTSDDCDSNDNLAEARDQANRLFAAADRAFSRVQSEDSLNFLSQIRQSGGQ